MSQTPERLQLIEDFVNTVELDGDSDQLDDASRLSRWFDARGIDVGDVSERDVARTIAVREAMRSLLSANNGEPLDSNASQVLNEAAAGAGLSFHVGADGRGEVTPTASGVDRALGYVLSAMFESMADGSWANMKACRSETCRWAFYDATKNHSKTWCSMSVCGNRAKVRNYRERQDR
ncbi:MAG: CGNR zinc finger domain-containing protein [Actinomycetota bacterium]|nr:CGNR zinc finger domain-containing protein [Actinomycetota bacterium]